MIAVTLAGLGGLAPFVSQWHRGQRRVEVRGHRRGGAWDRRHRRGRGGARGTPRRRRQDSVAYESAGVHPRRGLGPRAAGPRAYAALAAVLAVLLARALSTTRSRESDVGQNDEGVGGSAFDVPVGDGDAESPLKGAARQYWKRTPVEYRSERCQRPRREPARGEVSGGAHDAFVCAIVPADRQRAMPKSMTFDLAVRSA